MHPSVADQPQLE